MKFTMRHFDLEAIRAQVRAMDFVRGTPQDVAQWRLDDADSRANLAIEDIVLAPNETELFDMLMEEAVPPALVSKIVMGLMQNAHDEPSA